MLKYYSYYNIGGYKDMYLGDSTMDAGETYFFPLLPIWKQKAYSGDAKAQAKIESVAELTPIQLLNLNNGFELPAEAEPLFSHGGYKTIYTLNSEGKSIFAIRDIDSASKDRDRDRMPFLMVIVGTDKHDALILEKVAAYSSSHLESFSKDLAALFYYDPQRNGLVFKLSSLNAIINRIEKDGNNNLLTINGVKSIRAKSGTVSLLVLPMGISKEFAVNELGLKGRPIETISINQILPLDNQERLIEKLKSYRTSSRSIFTKDKMLIIVGGAVALGFLVGYIIGRP